MERLVQEERLPRTGIRVRVWGMNGKKVAVQNISKRSRRGKVGLGLGRYLFSLLVEGGGSTWLYPHLLPISPSEVFEPTVERGELVVRYRVRKSYSRRTTEATCK